MVKIYHRTIKDKQSNVLDDFRPNTWIHSVNPTKEEIELVSTSCKFNKDLLRDALDPYEVPRVETEDQTTYVFTRAPHKNERGEISTLPILIAISADHVATVSKGKFVFLEKFIKEEMDFSTTQRIKFFIQLFSEMNLGYTFFMTEISRNVRSKSAQLKKIGNKDIIQFVDFERTINDFLSALVPTNAMLHNLLSGKHLRLYEKDKDLIEDLFLSNKQLIEMCTSTLKTIVNIRDAYSTILTQDTNRVIKLLTSITIILTIPTIVASVYGMNVSLPFMNSSFAFIGVTAFSLLLMYVIAIIFLKKDWL